MELGIIGSNLIFPYSAGECKRQDSQNVKKLLEKYIHKDRALVFRNHLINNHIQQVKTQLSQLRRTGSKI